MNNQQNDTWAEGIWAGSVAFLAGFAGLYFGSMGLFRMGIPIGGWNSLLFVAPALAVSLALSPGRTGWLVFGMMSLVITVALQLASQFHDMTWDGMAVRQIWVEDVLIRKQCPAVLPSSHLLSAWLGWLGGNVDAGKAANPLLMICAFGFALKAAGAAGLKGGWKWIPAGVAALNPVSLYQLSSFYLDGGLAALFTCFCAALFLIFLNSQSRAAWSGAALCLGLMAAAKTSGLAYGVLLVAGLVTAILFKAGDRMSNLRHCAAGFLLLVSVGWLSHSMERESKYSLTGLAKSSDLRTPGLGIGSAPEEILRMNKLEAFFFSHLSPTSTWPAEWKIKPPFWFTRPELAVIQDLNPDARAGGFGPLYGTVLLLACWGALTGVLSRKIPWQSWIPGVTILGSCLLSQSWWARWVPQAWLLPLCLIMPVLVFCNANKSVWPCVLALAMAILNSALILIFYVAGCLENRATLVHQLEFLRKLPSPVYVWVPDFKSNLTWLTQAGIPWKTESSPPPPPTVKLQRTTTEVGLPPNWREIVGDEKTIEQWRKRRLLKE